MAFAGVAHCAQWQGRGDFYVRCPTGKWPHTGHGTNSTSLRSEPATDGESGRAVIAGTTTKDGLTVKVRLDRRTYRRGIKVSKKEMKALNLKSHDFHGEWNYTIAPKQRSA